MKKFLIVLLVLALTSMASAVSISLTSGGLSTLTLGVDVTVGQVITVDLVSDTHVYGINNIGVTTVGQTINTAVTWAPWAVALGMPGTLAGNAITGANGNGSNAVEGLAGTSLCDFQVTVNGVGSVTPVMTVADFFTNITGPAPNFWDGTQLTAQNPLNIVPEPMTIALLGLGGLFLRRRK